MKQALSAHCGREGQARPGCAVGLFPPAEAVVEAGAEDVVAH